MSTAINYHTTTMIIIPLEWTKINEELLEKSELNEEIAKLKILHKRELENLQQELIQAES